MKLPHSNKSESINQSIKTVRDNWVFHPPKNHLREQSEFVRMGGERGQGIFQGVLENR